MSRRMPQLGESACAEYLEGFELIGLREDRLPDLAACEREAGAEDGVAVDSGERVSAGRCVL